MALTPNERAARSRARKRGENVPKLKPGPKKGYKQSAEHVKKRAKFGEEHAAWAGDNISEKGGRKRALRKYKDIGPCVNCGSDNTERHHIDGNTANNEPDNIRILCRRCHMQEDGRLEEFRELGRQHAKKHNVAS